MTTLNRLAAAGFLVLPFAAGCGGKQEPPATPPPATLAAPPVAPAAPAATITAAPTPGVATASPAPAAPSRAPAGKASPVPPAATVPTTTLALAPATPKPAAEATPAPAAAPPSPAKLPTRPRPKGKVALPAKLGTVTFDHPKHAEAMAIPCAHCHHPSKPEKPLAAEQQACRECHTSPAAAPMKTSLQAAFHDPKAAAGTCLTCHREAVAKGKQSPVKCMDCHKK